MIGSVLLRDSYNVLQAFINQNIFALEAKFPPQARTTNNSVIIKEKRLTCYTVPFYYFRMWIAYQKEFNT
jgi:hypothetical protein